MQRSHKRNHTGIFGGGGSGKTTFATKYICNATSELVSIFDPEDEFSEILGIDQAETPEEIDAAIRSGWFLFGPHRMFAGDLEGALAYFSSLVLRVSMELPGRKFFVVDELGRYVSGSSVPKPLKVLVQTGRRYGIDCVFIGQQPNELHNTIRTQLSSVVCFQLTDETALEFPKNFGFNTESVRQLPPHNWICRTNQGIEVRS
jgi:hypothetical protein